MATIGIYDSGIGGLTTLAYIFESILGNDVYYYADNKNLPFGNKSILELEGIVKNAIAHMRDNCDKIVIACNTASCIAKDLDVVRLLPPLRNVKRMVDDVTMQATYVSNSPNIDDCCKNQDCKTLLMATPRTISTLKSYGMLQSGKIATASTSELASLIEANASISLKRQRFDMSETKEYLQQKLSNFVGVEKVILGCSHYLYVKKEIVGILGDVQFVDGNSSVLRALKKHIQLKSDESGYIHFDFSGQNEGEKYTKILKHLREYAMQTNDFSAF